MNDGPEAGARSRRFGIALGGILLLGLLLRLGYVVVQGGTDPWFHSPPPDGLDNLEWARELLSGQSRPGAYYGSPLYAYLLAGFLALFGEDFGLLYYLQQLGMVGAAGLLAWTGRRLIGEGAGLAAATLFLLYGPALFFASRLNGEPIAIFLLVLALWLWSGAGRLRGAAAGFVGGLAAVARPSLLAVPPAWAAGKLRGPWLRAVLLLLGLALALVPSTLRNYRVSGHLVPVSANAGITLYHGNNPRANGLITMPIELRQGGKRDQQRTATRVASRQVGRELDPVEADRYWGERAIAARAAAPLDTLRLLLLRCGLLISNAEMTLDGGPRQDANPLRHLAPLPWCAILGLAAAGLVLGGWRRTGGWPVWGAIAATVLAPLVFFVSSRYRLPLVTLCCLPAGAGLAALLRAEGGSGRRRAAALGVGSVVAALSLALPFGGLVDLADSGGLLQRGIAWSRLGDPARAEADYRAALERQPGSARALFYLGGVMESTGRAGEAARYYRESLEVSPRYANPACFLGQLLAEQTRSEEALGYLRRGLESDPYHEVCSNVLMATLVGLGRVAEAEDEFERATAAGVAVRSQLSELIRGLGAQRPPAENPAEDAGAPTE